MYDTQHRILFMGTLVTVKEPDKFIVWIDVDCGFKPEPDWEQNSPPQSLRTALIEAQECRIMEFPACICPEGETPRQDGQWSGIPD